jgi:hypothetical protein
MRIRVHLHTFLDGDDSESAGSHDSASDVPGPPSVLYADESHIETGGTLSLSCIAFLAIEENADRHWAFAVKHGFMVDVMASWKYTSADGPARFQSNDHGRINADDFDCVVTLLWPDTRVLLVADAASIHYRGRPIPEPGSLRSCGANDNVKIAFTTRRAAAAAPAQRAARTGAPAQHQGTMNALDCRLFELWKKAFNAMATKPDLQTAAIQAWTDTMENHVEVERALYKSGGKHLTSTSYLY